MIRPLRQRHRVMVWTLTVLLPVTFAVGLIARRPVPVVASVSKELTGPVVTPGQVIWTSADLWPGQSIVTTLHRSAIKAVTVEFMFRDLMKPDVLVYWAAGQETTAKGLPENVRLLGALQNQVPLPFPVDEHGVTGRFVLYSLADHEVVATSNPFLGPQN